MTAVFTTTGVLTDGKTLTLDTAAPVGSGPVRVTVETLVPVPAETPTWLLVLEQIWADQKTRGHVPMTREQIDEFMREERAGWDHRP